MTVIKHIWRYSLEEGKVNSEGLDNKSFSIVRKELITEECDPTYEYIMIINGNRAIDVAKNGKHACGKYDLAERICNYYKNKNKNIIVEQVLLDNDAPLALEAKMIARHVDLIAQNSVVNTINLIGHSKGGAILFSTPKYFKSDLSFSKTGITTTSAPFMGCLIASPTFFLSRVREVIFSQLPKYVAKYTYRALASFYKSQYTFSHMDNDIALQGYSSEKYDPDFIKGMFDRENINAMKKVRYYQNFTTGIDNSSLVDSLRRGDFLSVGMCLIDRFFMDEITDGFVETRSQESVKKHIDAPMRSLKSRTHCYIYHDDDLGVVLDSVNDNIDEHRARCKRKD